MKVLGCGNPYMGDDGFGPEVIRLLQEKEEGKNLELIQVSWGGISILDHFEGEKKVLILDAMELGSQPGTIHRFNSNELPPKYKGSYTTLHDLGILEALRIGRHICPEKMPDEIVFIGVEALEIKPFSWELSDVVKNSLSEVIGLIIKESSVEQSGKEP